MPAEQLLLTDTLQIEPADGVQLDPVNGSYTIRVRLRVERGPDQGYRDGGFLELAGLRILHFNGVLRFGAVETEMTRVVNSPAPGGAAGANSIPSTVELGTGGAHVAGMPDHTLGAAAAAGGSVR